jgi:hypothetical protein
MFENFVYKVSEALKRLCHLMSFPETIEPRGKK